MGWTVPVWGILGHVFLGPAASKGSLFPRVCLTPQHCQPRGGGGEASVLFTARHPGTWGTAWRTKDSLIIC